MEELLDDNAILTDKSVKIEKDKAIYVFKSTIKEGLAVKVNEYLKKQGYKLESGTNLDGVYGKGNKVMRILFGAFVKRFEWHVEISELNGSTGLIFTKTAKGYIGGVIGVQQVKKEYQRITGILEAFHANYNAK